MPRQRRRDRPERPAVTTMAGRNLYVLLGVSQSATSAEIRAAYVRLMKQYHPDSASMPGYAGQKGDLVPAINHCYAILKDPEKRAAYDAQLHPDVPARTGRGARPSPPGDHPAAVQVMRGIRPLRPAPAGPDARRSWTTMVYGLAGIAIVVALSWVAANWRPAFTDPRAGPAETVRLGAAPAAAVIPAAGRLDPLARGQVQLAASLSPEDSVPVSKQCFKAAKAEPGPAASELCIVFDDAVQYLNDGVKKALPPYFAPATMMARHSQAMSGFGDSSQERIDALRHATFTELLAELRPPPGELSAPPALDGPGPGEPVPAEPPPIVANPDSGQSAAMERN